MFIELVVFVAFVFFVLPFGRRLGLRVISEASGPSLGIGHGHNPGYVDPPDETFAFAACVPLLARAMLRALTAAAVVLAGSTQGTALT